MRPLVDDQMGGWFDGVDGLLDALSQHAEDVGIVESDELDDGVVPVVVRVGHVDVGQRVVFDDPGFRTVAGDEDEPGRCVPGVAENRPLHRPGAQQCRNVRAQRVDDEHHRPLGQGEVMVPYDVTEWDRVDLGAPPERVDPIAPQPRGVIR